MANYKLRCYKKIISTIQERANAVSSNTFLE